MAEVNFFYGSKANYNALASHDDNTLYFITDTLQLYKGEEEYTKSLQFVGDTLPTRGARQGVIYIKSTDFSAWRYTGSMFQRINKGYATKIPTSIDDADDTTVPTTKAVAQYVMDKLADVGGIQGVYVTDVQYNPKTGEIIQYKGGSGIPTVMTGIANHPEWNAETKTLTIPVFGEDALVIDFGKSSVLRSGSYNAKTKNLELVMDDGQIIKIPVGSLIDIYTGIATSTAVTSVGSDNKISVSVKVSAKANNQIVIENDGLYVALPDAYTKAEVDAKTNALSQRITNHLNDADSHVSAEDRASWDAKVGSAELASAKQSAIAAAALDATEKANQALAEAKAWANGLNTTMSNRVNALSAHLVWQQIPSND